MKKILAMVAALSVIVSLATAGTIAYLTDTTDVAENVMTMGNVDIDQIEEFTPTDLLPGIEVTKKVTVTNTGKSDAYVRTFVAFEKGEDNIWEKVIDYTYDNTNAWNWEATGFVIEVDGVEYDVFVANYNDVLEATETTPASLKSVSMDKTATNEDIAGFGDEYTVLVLSQGVQIAGFENAAAAFKGAFQGDADLNAAMLKAWFTNTEYKPEPPTPPQPEEPEVLDDEKFDDLAGSLDAGSSTYIYFKDINAVKDSSIIPASAKNTAYENVTMTIKSGSAVKVVGSSLSDAVTLDFNNCEFTLENGTKLVTGNKSALEYSTVVLHNVTVNGTLITKENYSNYIDYVPNFNVHFY